MSATVTGIYRHGVIELLEKPEGVPEGRVRVTLEQDEGGAHRHRRMTFGQFAGPRTSKEEDFKAAEWHGEPEWY